MRRCKLPRWAKCHIFNCILMPIVDSSWCNRRAISSFIITIPRLWVLFNNWPTRSWRLGCCWICGSRWYMVLNTPQNHCFVLPCNKIFFFQWKRKSLHRIHNLISHNPNNNSEMSSWNQSQTKTYSIQSSNFTVKRANYINKKLHTLSILISFNSIIRIQKTKVKNSPPPDSTYGSVGHIARANSALSWCPVKIWKEKIVKQVLYLSIEQTKLAVNHTSLERVQHLKIVALKENENFKKRDTWQKRLTKSGRELVAPRTAWRLGWASTSQIRT